jgi:hypothetical protein
MRALRMPCRPDFGELSRGDFNSGRRIHQTDPVDRASAFCVIWANRSVATLSRVFQIRGSCNHAEWFLDRMARCDVVGPDLPAPSWVIEGEGDAFAKGRRVDEKTA